MGRVDVVIAGVKIPVPLEDRDVAADGAEDAERMLLSEGRPGRLLDDLDLDAADVALDPFVEDGAEEIAPGRGPDRLGADAARRVRARLDEREKGHGRRADLPEEAVDLERPAGVVGADDAEDVGRDAVAAQDVVAAHRVVEGRPAVAGQAIAVVDLARTVEAEPDREPLGREEPAPFVVEERAVGLQAVGDRPSRRAEPALDLDDPAEVIEAEDGRLAAVPGEADDLVGRGGDVLGDIGFEEVVGHAATARPPGPAGPLSR